MLQPLEQLEDLINSEGYILRIMLRLGHGREFDQFMLEGTVQDLGKVYCKTNPFTVYLYLNDIIKTKDLFIVRQDESYFIKQERRYRRVFYNATFHSEVINKIQCGDLYYYELPDSMRIHSAIEDYMNKLFQLWPVS